MRGAVISMLAVLQLIVTLSGCRPSCSDIRPTELKCEYRTNPFGLDQTRPRLSWIPEGEGRWRKQTAYQILVASSREMLDQDRGDLWDSQKVLSEETVNIPYQGNSLRSKQECFWKVRIWDEDSLVSRWSDPGQWSMGLLDSTDWKALWVGYDQALSDSAYPYRPWGNGVKLRKGKRYRPLPSLYLRKEFSVEGDISSARVYATAQGVYVLYVNGQRVGEDHLMPGWTDYNQRIHYQTYDVASLLKEGENTIAAILGDGWFAGSHANRGQHFYGTQLRFIAQLHLDFQDRSERVITTDDTWKATYGPIRISDLQGGETYDARLEADGWNESGFDDKLWANVDHGRTVFGSLVAYPNAPIRHIDEIKPVSVDEQRSGVYVVDMGQNFSGWARITAQGQRGDSIVMKFGEALNPDGSVHTRNLRSAHCTDTYVIKSSDMVTWEPKFTYRGYRYIEVEGYPGELTGDQITGIVLHSDLEQVGTFESSDTQINRLYNSIVWSQRSNFVDIPTDCPQRDERLGWAGDVQVFMRTACYNMDAAAFFHKWLNDLNESRFGNNPFPNMAPAGNSFGGVSAGWGDARVICPWHLFQVYNDTQMIVEHYDMMIGWMNHRALHHEQGISTLSSFGDWHHVDDKTPIPVVSTAYYKHVADLMAEMSSIIGREGDGHRYRALSDTIFNAFNEHYVDDSGKVDGHTQTGYLLALAFDLLPDSLVEIAVDHLVADIVERDTTLSTGILGTHLLLSVLSEHGHTDLAYELLLNTKYPSWGHMIKNGATTTWERWDGFSYDSGMHEDSTNSLNHYALGSVGEWFYSTIAGIRSDGPGYKKIMITPQPGGELTYVKARYKSIRGVISSSWRWEGDHFELEVEVPINTEASVYIPTNDPDSVTESDLSLDVAEGVEVLQETGEVVIVRIGSGTYSFRSSLPNG